MWNRELIKHLFDDKPLMYAMVWSYIYSLEDDILQVRVSADKMCAIIGVEKNYLYKILSYGCSKINYSFFVKSKKLCFVNATKEHVEQLTDAQRKEIVKERYVVSNEPEKVNENENWRLPKPIKSEYSEAIIMAIKYLNDKALTTYKPTTKANIQCLTSLFKKKYNLSQIYLVIDFKCNQWLNTEMEVHLNPSTLFGKKFESYYENARVQHEKTHKKQHAEPAQASLFETNTGVMPSPTNSIYIKLNEINEDDFTSN
jgi:uncharacterized phage protein (TIGR02220 family)